MQTSDFVFNRLFIMLMPSYVLKVKEPDTDKPAPKRKKRRERVQEATQISTLQVCIFLKKKNLNT